MMEESLPVSSKPYKKLLTHATLCITSIYINKIYFIKIFDLKIEWDHQ